MIEALHVQDKEGDMADGGNTSRHPVHQFDYVADPGLIADVHARYWRLKNEAPPLFWTDFHGGHWVCNSSRSVLQVLRHPEIFSNRILSIPPNPRMPVLIPEMLDPPEHRPYRSLLRPFFEKKAISQLESRVVEWSRRLIGDVIEQGECDFTTDIAARLPVAIFMELFGFPMDRYEEFRHLAASFSDARLTQQARSETAAKINGHIAALIRDRQLQPRDDMFSQIIESDLEGRRLTFDELMSIGLLMFTAGLDTVANAMGFGMRHLAHDGALQDQIMADPTCIPDLVEELLRRYAFVAVTRYVVEDCELEAAQLKAGDSILVPLALVGWDDSLSQQPETVSIDRAVYRHAAFGSGVHTCLGIHLARMELTLFYQIWFELIGRFRQLDTHALTHRAGPVFAIERLTLGWDPPSRSNSA